MIKYNFILLMLSLSFGGCATINSFKDSFEKPKFSPSIIERSDYISSAIADWIIEEAKSEKAQIIGISNIDKSNNFDEINSNIIEKLKSNGLNVTNENDNSALSSSYLVSEIDDKILIKIQTKEQEVSRLFAKGEANSIIPISPLSVRIIK